MSTFVSQLSNNDFTACVKMLDSSIAAAKANDLGRVTLCKLLTNRGTCFARSQQYDKALKDYDSALQLCPNDVNALCYKGHALAASGKSDEACSTWQSALKLAAATSDAEVLLQALGKLQAKGIKPYVAKHSGSLLPPRSVVWMCLPLLLILGILLAPASLQKAMPSISITFSPGAITSMTSEAGECISPPVPNLHRSDTPFIDANISTTPNKPIGAAQPVLVQSSSEKKGASLADVPLVPKPQPPEEPPPPSIKKDRKAPPPSPPSQRPSSKPPPAEEPIGDVATAIAVAVGSINSGRVAEANALLDRILAVAPRELGALVARGTARALLRDLEGSIEDFTAAIDVEPRYSDSYKRRAQALSALGRLEEALDDLNRAGDLLPMWGQASPSSKYELMLEKATVYQKLRNFRMACDLMKQLVSGADTISHTAWNLYGLCSMSMGNIDDGILGFRKAVSKDPKYREAWINLAQLLKEAGDISGSESAFQTAFNVETPDHTVVPSMRSWAAMKQQMGRHEEAVEILHRAEKLANDDQRIELYFLRAACYHALGYVREAVNDYNNALTWAHGTPSDDARSQQFLAFYQKELALYMAAHFDKPVANFSLDVDIAPVFKELWCKKGPPSSELIRVYRPQPQLPTSGGVSPPRPDPELLGKLTEVADRFGSLLQNQHRGFLPHRRQQRAAGYAAIELGQVVLSLVAARRAGGELELGGQGSTGKRGLIGPHKFGWRDAMEVVVKWRQLAEPNDQVIWVDLLTEREFAQGFGSHTPMFTGQTKTVRYYTNFNRSLALHKQNILDNGYAVNADNQEIPVRGPGVREAIEAAQTAEDMYKIIKNDSWVVMHIESTSRPGETLEGTRFTLVRDSKAPDAYEFSIRTPVTPPRWEVFDDELAYTWEAVMNAMVEGADERTLAPLIMTYAYYWYNFMPLARGTAACGYTTMLSLFWVAGMPVTATIPKNYQVDWEAILARGPTEFIGNVSPWLYPAAARNQSEVKKSEPPSTLPPISTLPAVSTVLSTLRQRLEALNGDGARRVG